MSRQFQQRENQGSLFPNDRKANENQPDVKGQGEVTCPHCRKPVPLWLSAWKKVTQKGVPWLSLAFSIREEQQQETRGGGSGDRQGRDFF